MDHADRRLYKNAPDDRQKNGRAKKSPNFDTHSCLSFPAPRRSEILSVTGASVIGSPVFPEESLHKNALRRSKNGRGRMHRDTTSVRRNAHALRPR